MAPGQYNWPFSLRLPVYLPASFEDQPYGRVQYFAKVVVERPWKGAIETLKHFTVLGMLDLNTDADAKVRPEMLVCCADDASLYKHYCVSCCCCC